MASVGEILTEKRNELGLTIEDVHKKTRINPKYIIALENNDFEKIPGEAYARGFLGLYSQTLGIDGKALIAQYKREAKGLPEEVSLAEKEEPLARDLVKKPRSKWLFVGILAAVALIVLGYLGWWTSIPKQKPPKLKPIVAPEKEKSPQGSETPKPTPPPPPPAGVDLTITVVDSDCWMEVTTDGNRVFSGTLKVGETQKWHGEKSIYLYAASGKRIKAIFNGTDLGLLNQTGEVVKKTFTPEGIKEGEVTP